MLSRLVFFLLCLFFIFVFLLQFSIIELYPLSFDIIIGYLQGYYDYYCHIEGHIEKNACYEKESCIVDLIFRYPSFYLNITVSDEKKEWIGCNPHCKLIGDLLSID